jgi:F-type H+-transporting ATPase subunit delta
MKPTRKIRRHAKALFRCCLVDGLLDEARVRQAVGLLKDAHQRGRFALLDHFRRLVRLYVTQHTATIESAVALPADLTTSVNSSLTKVYGGGLTTSFIQRPELIGGMRIKVGSDVYDGTVRGRLAALEARL